MNKEIYVNNFEKKCRLFLIKNAECKKTPQ